MRCRALIRRRGRRRCRRYRRRNSRRRAERVCVGKHGSSSDGALTRRRSGEAQRRFARHDQWPLGAALGELTLLLARLLCQQRCVDGADPALAVFDGRRLKFVRARRRLEVKEQRFALAFDDWNGGHNVQIDVVDSFF